MRHQTVCKWQARSGCAPRGSGKWKVDDMTKEKKQGWQARMAGHKAIYSQSISDTKGPATVVYLSVSESLVSHFSFIHSSEISASCPLSCSFVPLRAPLTGPADTV